MPYPDTPLPIGPIGPLGFLEPPGPVSPVAEVHELGALGTQIREGQVYTGRVVRAGGGRVVLRFGHQQFSVPTRHAFQAGEEVTARAVALNGRVALEVLPRRPYSASRTERQETIVAQLRALGIEPTESAQAAARTLHILGLGLRPELLETLARLLGRPGALSAELSALAQTIERYTSRDNAAERDALRALAARLERILLAADDPELAEKIVQFARESGLFAEARLRHAAEQGSGPDELLANDLKWALLRLQSRLRAALTPGDEAGQTALAQIERTLAMIEAHQLEDVAGQRAGYFMLELPFQAGTGFEGARIRFFYRRGPAGEPRVDSRNWTALVDVTMSRLGELKALLTVVRGTLSCQIMSSRVDVVELLRSEVQSLQGALDALPFTVADVACLLTPTEDEDTQEGNAHADPVPTRPGRLDLNA